MQGCWTRATSVGLQKNHTLGNSHSALVLLRCLLPASLLSWIWLKWWPVRCNLYPHSRRARMRTIDHSFVSLCWKKVVQMDWNYKRKWSSRILSPVNIIRDLVVYKSSISNEQLQRGLLWVQYFAQWLISVGSTLLAWIMLNEIVPFWYL